MTKSIIPFVCASVAILVMNTQFEGGFKVERVLVSFGLFLGFKLVFNLFMKLRNLKPKAEIIK